MVSLLRIAQDVVRAPDQQELSMKCSGPVFIFRSNGQVAGSGGREVFLNLLAHRSGRGVPGRMVGPVVKRASGRSDTRGEYHHKFTKMSFGLKIAPSKSM